METKRRTDGWTLGGENIIPHHFCVPGYKNIWKYWKMHCKETLINKMPAENHLIFLYIQFGSVLLVPSFLVQSSYTITEPPRLWSKGRNSQFELFPLDKKKKKNVGRRNTSGTKVNCARQSNSLQVCCRGYNPILIDCIMCLSSSLNSTSCCDYIM